MKYLLILFVAIFTFSSCEKYRDCVLPVAGLYDAQIVGVTGPFTMGVSIDYGDNIEIDAQWLKDLWYVVEADTNGCADYYNEDYETLNPTCERRRLNNCVRANCDFNFHNWGTTYFF
jgi:hypothetical protein